MGTHKKRLGEALLMRNKNIRFYGELKAISELSANTHL